MTPAAALHLGRVSNLPTVWTNVLAALALAGAPLWEPATLVLLIALSLFYAAGMYLNDAFDSAIDAIERPSRPIPAGLATRTSVFLLGFLGLMVGIVMTVWTSVVMAPGGISHAALTGLSATALAGMIVLYDVWHKTNPGSPILMGLCRMLVYATVAVAATGEFVILPLTVGALLLCYVIGLTYAAKQEHLARVGNLWPLGFLSIPFVGALFVLPQWDLTAFVLFAAFLAWAVYAISLLVRKPPRVGKSVVSLIAGISLFDALWLAIAGVPLGALLAAGAFLLTLGLQRWVPGT